ncbi:hypothetical protein LCGC14_3136040, partial [marine sediment metagenome]
MVNENSTEENMVVTPWEVRGFVDYDKLIKKFGTKPFDENLQQRLAKFTDGDLHY